MIHRQFIRDICAAAEARHLHVWLWNVKRDAGFLLTSALVAIEVKSLQVG